MIKVMEKYVILGKITEGFTLIEVMVAMFIMSVSTMLLLSNYPDSTVRLTLLNYTQSLTLLAREAQIRGGSVDSGAVIIGGYGIHIDNATNSQAILFSDSVEDGLGNVIGLNPAGLSIGDGLFDRTVSPGDTLKSTLVLKPGFVIKKTCVASSTASEYLSSPKPFLCSTVNGIPIRSLTVSFMRPSQAAHVHINGENVNDFDSACIELYSPKSPIPGHIRSVQVFHSGVIISTARVCD